MVVVVWLGCYCYGCLGVPAVLRVWFWWVGGWAMVMIVVVWWGVSLFCLVGLAVVILLLFVLAGCDVFAWIVGA